MEPFSLFRVVWDLLEVGRPCSEGDSQCAEHFKAWFEESGAEGGGQFLDCVDESAREIEVDYARFCAAIGAVVSDFDATLRTRPDSVLAQLACAHVRAPRGRRPRRGASLRDGAAAPRRRRAWPRARGRGARAARTAAHARAAHASRRSSGSATSAPARRSARLGARHGRAHAAVRCRARARVPCNAAARRCAAPSRRQGHDARGPLRTAAARAFELLRARDDERPAEGEAAGGRHGRRERGRVPRTLEVELLDALVDAAVPGDTVPSRASSSRSTRR